MSSAFRERRAESRTIVDRYYNVEFQFETSPLEYRCKVWDRSLYGMGVLVKEGSELLKHLKLGAHLKVRIFEPGSPLPRDFRKAQVRHMSRAPEERAKDHYLVGLLIEGIDQAHPIQRPSAEPGKLSD